MQKEQGATSWRLFLDGLTDRLAAGGFGRSSWCIAPVVLALGLAVTALLAWTAQRASMAELKARFEGRVDIAGVEITRRIGRAEVALRGVRAAYAVHGRLKRREFATFVAARELELDVPGVRGLGFIERVPRGQLAAFVERERADDGADFQVSTAGAAPDLYVIKLIEPLERNRPAWGFDVGAEPVRREAIQRAVDTGQAALTGRVTLVQDQQGGPGWLVFVPVFAGPPRDAQTRWAGLVGLLYAPIVASEVLADTKKTLGGQFDFQVFDGDPAQGRLLFDSERAIDLAAPGGQERRFASRLFQVDRRVTVAGRDLWLRLASSQDTSSTVAGLLLPALVTGLAGAVLSVLLALSACLLIQGRRRALDLAAQMTADLQRAAADVRARNEQLRANEELMRVVTDNLPAGVSYWDADLRCRFANRGFLQGRGFSRDDVLGRPVREVVGAAEFTPAASAVAKAMGGEAQQLELQDDPGSGLRTRQLHLIPDLDGQQVRGLFAIALDITEIKRVRDLAVQASAAKSLFLANMSHEIRTPMNAVLGMLTLLADTRLDDRQRDFAQRAESSARSLLSLLNDILDFSKVEAGQIALDPHPFRLDDLLGSLSVVLAPSVGGKDIELVFDVESAVSEALVGDDLRLGQVLINLAGNAVKFTERGEVVVRVRVQPTVAGDARLEVEVRDTGIGIAPEHLRRIFEPFDQAEASTTRRFGGTGLGLAISQRLVHLMGGQIQVSSEPGQGSCFGFSLVLPRAPAAVPAPALPCRVLLVDDNATARAAQAAMLRSLGWQVDLAASGVDALERLRQPREPYDAVLLDWAMPGLDGWQTAARIRALPGGHRLALILLVTGLGRESLGRRSAYEQALLDGILVKPVTATMVAEALRQARLGPQGAPLPAPGATAALAGLRVLVVEDNPNNQIVARELLARQGALVDIAADGEQAVAKVAAAPPAAFDVVLMDLQMPVMDGFTATRAIRERLGRTDLPIIAMTANAMESDRTACLAAGMVDHIGKPIVLSHLVQVLQRHTRLASRPDPMPPEPSPRPEPPAATGGPLRLDRAAAIDRLGGSPELYAQVLEIFGDTLPASCAELRAHLAAGRRAEASRLAHSIKGSAGTVGADLLMLREAEATLAHLAAG